MFLEVAAIVSTLAAGALYIDRKHLKAIVAAAISYAENKESAISSEVKTKLVAIVADAKAEAAKVETTAAGIVGKIEADIKAKI